MPDTIAVPVSGSNNMNLIEKELNNYYSSVVYFPILFELETSEH